MPVTKQTYTANAPWTFTDAADVLRDAFIDAGLMAAWHDSFTVASGAGTGAVVRVLKIEHDSTKTYGSSFYAFYFLSFGTSIVYSRVHLASGWNASGTPPVNVPTGTQYLDWERLPTSYTNSSGSGNATDLASPTLSPTSNLFLDRYTSQDDSKQSWFVWRQQSSGRNPFTVLHKDTVLHPWLNLDQGMISGLHTAHALVNTRAGVVNFRLEENLRRCLSIGTALRGTVFTTSGLKNTFHNASLNAYTYVGMGIESADYERNVLFNADGISNSNGSAVILPVGKSVANPGFVTDYIPVCTELPWSPWTPTLLANDFGICMYYDDNSIGYGDRIIVQSALNEWQVINQANNANVNDGASATFLARLI
jgi:hypothetical protein